MSHAKKTPDAIERASYDLAKKVPDMRHSGLRIETAYGELELNSAESQPIIDLIERVLKRRLVQAGGTA